MKRFHLYYDLRVKLENRLRELEYRSEECSVLDCFFFTNLLIIAYLRTCELNNVINIGILKATDHKNDHQSKVATTITLYLLGGLAVTVLKRVECSFSQ